MSPGNTEHRLPTGHGGPVGRLAPSPTGLLHLGHVRSFLVAWWHARSRDGRVLLRVEDLDADRSDPRYVDALKWDLEWLGLDWDGAPRIQSQHLRPMQEALDALAARGLAYPCVCSRRDVLLAQSAPQLGVTETRYPGTCRGRYASVAEAERRTQRPAGLRFRVPEGVVPVRDAFADPVEIDVGAEAGDFLVARRSGAPAYQLAVVVDDAEQGVTEVVRGADLLASTARQILLQRALGLTHPEWVHLPLVLDESGRRLAKRTDALSLEALRARGADPRSIVAWAARVSGVPVDGRVAAREVVPAFQLARLPPDPVVMTSADIDSMVAS
jgi:glutamyl-tRNA synthetase